MGLYVTRLLSVASGALAVLVALVVMSPPGQVGARHVGPAHSTQPTALSVLPQNAIYDPKSVMATASALGPYLVRHPDGTLGLNPPAEVVNRLPASDVQTLTSGLNALNRRIAAGQLQTTAGGAVFDPKAVGLMFQGGWSGIGQDWWHSYWCLNHNDLVAANNGWWWDLSAAGIGVIAYLAGPIGAAMGIVYVFKAWMTAVDRGNGSCLNEGHWPPPNIWVTGQ